MKLGEVGVGLYKVIYNARGSLRDDIQYILVSTTGHCTFLVDGLTEIYTYDDKRHKDTEVEKLL